MNKLTRYKKWLKHQGKRFMVCYMEIPEIPSRIHYSFSIHTICRLFKICPRTFKKWIKEKKINPRNLQSIIDLYILLNLNKNNVKEVYSTMTLDKKPPTPLF